MKKILVILMLLAAATIAGCGGGNVGDGDGNPPIVQDSNTRMIQAGDTIHYGVTGTVTTAGETTNVTGTASMTTSQGSWAPSYGASALKQEIEIHLNGGSDPVSITRYLEQAQDGTIYLVRYEDGQSDEHIASANHPPVSYPGTFVAGTNWSYYSMWQGTSSYMESRSVAIDPAELVAGYRAFKVHTSSTRDTITTQSDEWFSPKLGYPVKTNVLIDAGTTDMNLTLTFVTKNF